MDPGLRELVETVLRDDTLMVLGMIIVGSLAVVFGTLTGMMKHMFREKSRREIAAYIAEGSMTPEQGMELMKAQPKND